jgi:hypothetical protein
MLYKFFIILLTLHLYGDELIHESESTILNHNTFLNTKKIENEKYRTLKEKKNQSQELAKTKENTDLTTAIPMLNTNFEKINTVEANENSFTKDGIVYVNSKFKVSPVVSSNEIYYKINSGFWHKFFEPFTLDDEGKNEVSIRVIDANKTIISEQKFIYYLDTTRPSIKSSIEGDYIVNNFIPYYKSKPKIKIEVIDQGVGVKEVLYSINGSNYQSREEIEKSLNGYGLKEIKIKATDFLNKDSEIKRIRFFLDTEHPSIELSFNEIPSFEENQFICLRGSKFGFISHDHGVGLDKVLYRKSGKDKWKNYRNNWILIKKSIQLEFKAIDLLGNESPVKSFNCLVRERE